ncbi:TetR/AcrR family transcriptional regulator [Leucobacter chromiireducens]|uniref:TetR/AcrR family transcriptional regulator n=1 Tax=Leucobacter chromiireducens TaxID=283877 RepID=UPI000F63C30E|nr:TetR/AcrR family transcriptional regulator [Leucobacter chromiireducens]
MTERRVRRRPGENRERLQEAGLIEFGLLGFHGTSTGRVAARASVPQPHVYANFRTKQELFLACVERAVDTVLAAGGVSGYLRDPGDLGGSDASEAARVIFQAYAAAQDPGLVDALSPLLDRFERGVDVETRNAVLGRAGSALRAPAPEAGRAIQ